MIQIVESETALSDKTIFVVDLFFGVNEGSPPVGSRRLIAPSGLWVVDALNEPGVTAAQLHVIKPHHERENDDTELVSRVAELHVAGGNQFVYSSDSRVWYFVGKDGEPIRMDGLLSTPNQTFALDDNESS